MNKKLFSFKLLIKLFFIITFLLTNDIYLKNGFCAVILNKDKTNFYAYEAANKKYISISARSLSGFEKPKVFVTNHTNSSLNIDFSNTAFMPEKSDGQRMGLTGLPKLDFVIGPHKSKTLQFNGLCLDKTRTTPNIKLDYKYLSEPIPDSISELLKKNASQDEIWKVTEGSESANWKSMDPRNKELFRQRQMKILLKRNYIFTNNNNSNLYQKILNSIISEKEIKTISFSESGGSVVIGENNDLWTYNIPKETELKLKELNNKKAVINYIAFNKDNGWVIIYDKNKSEFSKIPKELEELLKSVRERNLEIKKFTFSPNNGWLLTYGFNGLSYSKFPIEMGNLIEDLTYWGIKIKTVVFTKDFGWLIVFGNNNIAHKDLPLVVTRKLYELYNKDKVIKNIAFSPLGDWVITEK